MNHVLQAPIGIRARRLTPKYAVVVSVAAGGWLAGQLVTRGLPLWIEVGHTAGYLALFLAPLAGALAAYQTVTSDKAPIVEHMVTSSRSDAGRSLVVVGAEVIGVGIGYVALVGWLSVRTWVGASAGSPDLEMIGAGFAAISAGAAVGFFAARVIPARVTAPLVGVGLWAAIWAMAANRTSPLLSPMLQLEPVPFLPFDARVGLTQSLWFLALAAALFGAGLLWKEWTPGIAMVCISATIIAGASAIALVSLGPLPFDDPPPPRAHVCTERGSLEVCVYQEYEPVLDEVFGVVSAVVAPLIEATGTPTRAFAVPDTDSARLEFAQDPTSYPYVFTSIGPRGFDPEIAREVTARDIVGYGFCPALPGDSIRDGLALWLLENSYESFPRMTALPVVPSFDPGSEAAAFRDQLRDMTVSRRRAWLANTLPDLQNCGRGSLPPP